ncbi:DUF4932 domain-containing protein [Sediminicola luteus]|nr:DUF4932 domain-containing protein [Sediminicola luteus]
MKKSVLLLTLCQLFSWYTDAQSLQAPKVDHRVELLSIVFRLAELREYNAEEFSLYTQKIKTHFEPHKGHRLITFAKELRKTNHIGFDAVMSMAVQLDKNLDPRIEFSEKLPDERWDKENANTFVSLLKAFYIDADCETFFNENKALYTAIEARFSALYDQIDLNWYKAFYGSDSKEKFIIVPGLGNGRQNYGPAVQEPNKQREVYAIVGSWKTDDSGIVIFPKEIYLHTLIHEFCHSFVNHLIDKNKKALQESGEKLFQPVKEIMRQQNYGHWTTLLYESMVRASVIKYMKDHHYSEEVVQKEINEQLSLGYLWIEDLLLDFEAYDLQRSTYPTLEEYMPRLIEAFQTYTQKIGAYTKKIDAQRPKILSISEFANYDQNVPSQLKKVTINFNKPVRKGVSINKGKPNEAFPNFKDHALSADKKSLTLTWSLEPNKAYGFILTGIAIKSEEGFPIKDYPISFHTE